MARHVLCISSQVAYGPVGSTAAAPALQAAGFTVLQVPTIILSNHPGLGKPSGVRLPAADIAAILKRLDELDVLKDCVGAMTGYFADAAQVTAAATSIRAMRQANPALYILVDPVLGDGEGLYVSIDVANAIRDELVPLASSIAPNRLELAWLTGLPVMDISDAVHAARTLACEEVVATSIPAGDGALATLTITNFAQAEVITRIKLHVPHGTGDFLSGLYLASRLNGYEPAQALQRSSAILELAIARSLGEVALDIVGALHDH